MTTGIAKKEMRMAIKQTSKENITVWDSPDEGVHTITGSMSYLDWCNSEIRRIRAKGGKAELYRCVGPNGKSLVCVGRGAVQMPRGAK